jgi:RNA recognition motif-containing protein
MHILILATQAFSEYGAITDANVVYDRETGRSRGFGFVTFTDKASAEKAVTGMNQAVIFPSISFPIARTYLQVCPAYRATVLGTDSPPPPPRPAPLIANRFFPRNSPARLACKHFQLSLLIRSSRSANYPFAYSRCIPIIDLPTQPTHPPTRFLSRSTVF